MKKGGMLRTLVCNVNKGISLINRARFRKLLMKLAADRPADFVGIGIIAYSAIEGLPVVSLGSVSNAQLDLPVSGEDNVSIALSSLATRRSARHDGFHLIEANSGNLTHIAQFVSPPLGAALANPQAAWPHGARQMTALLISTLPQVEIAGVVSADGDVQLYENGTPTIAGVYM